MNRYTVELLDKDGKVVDPMIDNVIGTGDHKVSATKELNKLLRLNDLVKDQTVLLGVTNIRLSPMKTKERKAHKRLTLLQKKALRKDSKKLSVKELAAKYDVSLPTAKKYLS